MPEFLLESYVSDADPDQAAQDAQRVREAARALTVRGTPVRYCRSMFVSAEETHFVLLEADSIEAVYEAARLARVTCDRVSAAVSDPGAHDDDPGAHDDDPGAHDDDPGAHDDDPGALRR
jgi:hypothetical protein